MNEHKDILLVFMDIDYLRRINNDFGRAAGDEVIVAAADALRMFWSNWNMLSHRRR